jgi:hypothetical protein
MVTRARPREGEGRDHPRLPSIARDNDMDGPSPVGFVSCAACGDDPSWGETSSCLCAAAARAWLTLHGVLATDFLPARRTRGRLGRRPGVGWVRKGRALGLVASEAWSGRKLYPQPYGEARTIGPGAWQLLRLCHATSAQQQESKQLQPQMHPGSHPGRLRCTQITACRLLRPPPRPRVMIGRACPREGEGPDHPRLGRYCAKQGRNWNHRCTQMHTDNSVPRTPPA